MYLKVEVRDATNQWRNIPLSVTDSVIDEDPTELITGIAPSGKPEEGGETTCASSSIES